MIKKRLLSFLGAAAITAALTFAVVSLSPSNGFTSGTMQEGLCYEATGVAPDAIVASLNGNGASADLIAYWIGYDVSYLDSYMQYYTGSSLDWDYTLSDGTNITGFDLVDAGKAGAIADALTKAKIDTSKPANTNIGYAYSASNPMVWVV